MYRLGINRQAGFTLVELLFVIVLIGILATISIVAYNNIVERAYSARVISTVEAYMQGLRLYYAENGQLPPNGWQAGCLGKTSDYPTKDGFEAGSCTRDSYGYASFANDDFANTLSSYTKNNMPDPTIKLARETYSNGAWTEYRGIYYEQWGAVPDQWAFMEYAVKGKVVCPKEYTTRYGEAENITYCNQIFEATINY